MDDDEKTPVDFAGATGDNQRMLDEIVAIAEEVVSDSREVLGQVRTLQFVVAALFLLEISHWLLYH